MHMLEPAAERSALHASRGKRRRGVVLGLATAALALALALGLGELAVRIALSDITTTGNSDDYFGRRWRSGIAVNSLGFREREVTGAPDAGVYRIAVIGDSFTFGLGIDQADRMTERLAEILGAFSPRVEVLNFGRPGRETVHHVATLREVVLPLQPDFVLMQWLSNDVQGRVKTLSTGIPLVPWDRASDALRGRSALFTLVEWQWARLQRALGLAEGYVEYMDRRFSDPSSPDMIAAESDLREFVSVAREAGVEVGIVAFPNLAVVESAGDFPLGYLIDRVMAACADEQIPCLDLREPLLEVAGQDGWWANRLDSHPGPLTNAVAARAVAEFFGEHWMMDATGAPHPPPAASQR
jgi:hypothetical protein